VELSLERGRIVDGYVIRDLLAQSANATLWRVDHAQRGTRHVLKVLHKADGRRRARVEQEVMLGSVLQHRNVVRCTQVVEVQNHAGLVMDYVDGPSLDQWLRADPPDDLATRLRIFRGLCDGVAAAHARGIVHRGLKPSNVLLQAEMTGDRMDLVVKIADFGVAKALEPEVGKYGGLTTVNTGLGTWGYAAPEQIRDASTVDHRADLYSMGCLLYELLCGIPPFAHLAQFQAFQAQREGRFRSPRELVPGLPEGLYQLIESLLSPDPAQRPPTVEAVIRVIDAVAAQAAELPPTAEVAAAPAADDADGGELATLLVLCSIPTAALLFGAAVVFLAR
jgi:serine/threonine protein kinase